MYTKHRGDENEELEPWCPVGIWHYQLSCRLRYWRMVFRCRLFVALLQKSPFPPEGAFYLSLSSISLRAKASNRSRSPGAMAYTAPGVRPFVRCPCRGRCSHRSAPPTHPVGCGIPDAPPVRPAGPVLPLPLAQKTAPDLRSQVRGVLVPFFISRSSIPPPGPSAPRGGRCPCGQSGRKPPSGGRWAFSGPGSR